MLYPMCVWLLIIPDENSKQHNHSNLPDKADSRQTDPNIGVLSAAEQIAHAVTTVPHGADSLLVLRWSLLALLWCPAVSQEIYMWLLRGVCSKSPLTNRGRTHLVCWQVNHSFPSHLYLLLQPGHATINNHCIHLWWKSVIYCCKKLYTASFLWCCKSQTNKMFTLPRWSGQWENMVQIRQWCNRKYVQL